MSGLVSLTDPLKVAECTQSTVGYWNRVEGHDALRLTRTGVVGEKRRTATVSLVLPPRLGHLLRDAFFPARARTRFW